MFVPRRSSRRWWAIVLLTGAAGVLAGCASPASPRAPSLHLPEPVRDLVAVRSGDEVQLRFTLPRRTTDGEGLGDTPLQGSLCRQDEKGEPCRPAQLPASAAALPVHAAGQIVWTDSLPENLRMGAPRVLAYRVILRNAEGRSAGPSDPAYTAAGETPPPVEDFRAEGSRAGVLLRWTPVGDKAEVLVERTQLNPKPSVGKNPAAAPAPSGRRSKSQASVGASREERPAAPEGAIWLTARADGVPAGTSGVMIDATAAEGVRYRYTAIRQFTTKIGGRTLELRSAPCVPAEITWRDVYPPAAPQALTALGYAVGQGGEAASGYAVDLVWQPVNDPRVSGYAVFRQVVDASGVPQGEPERLTFPSVATPAFHDAGADPIKGYRYSVYALDARGNRSAAATALVSPPSR